MAAKKQKTPPMKVIIKSFYVETVENIFYHKFDIWLEKDEKGVQTYSFLNDDLYEEIDKWLDYAGACGLVLDYKIERS